jgi:hypothetical protein
MGEILTYDVMGNITSMARYNGTTIELGTYSYSNGNQLEKITSGGLATLVDYVYDVNGNSTRDGRKNTALTYNQLNLPATATGTGFSKWCNYRKP